MKFFALFVLIAMIATQALALPAPESAPESPAGAKAKRAVYIYSSPLATTYHFPSTYYSSYVPSVYSHYSYLL